MRSSFETKRLKLQSKFKDSFNKDQKIKNSSIQKEQIFSMKDSNILNMKNQNQTSQTLKKSLQDLQQLFNEQKLHNEELNSNLNKVYIKNIQRQTQYKNIIQRMIPYCLKDKIKKLINADLKQVHNDIITLFDQSNNQHELQLQQQISNLKMCMQKKIQELQNSTYKQLQNNKKYLKLNYEKIQRQISQILILSRNIYDQNQKLKQKVRKLEFNNQLIKQQRQLLIHQLINNKKVINKIYKQLKNKYNKDQQIDVFINKLKSQKKDVQREFTKFQMKKKGEKEKGDRDWEEWERRRQAVFSGLQNNDTIPNQKISNGRTLSRNKKNVDTIETIFSLKKEEVDKFFSKTVNIKPTNYLTPSYKSSQSRRLTSQQSMHNSKVPMHKINNTVEHLQQTLKRQKKKVQSLKRQLIYLRQYQTQLQKILKQLLTTDKNLKYGENIRNIIKQLSNRLINNTKCPTINSGFMDLNLLLQNDKQQSNIIQ